MNDRHANSQARPEHARQGNERAESHPFRVGETYANRRGSYEVMQIAPPKMTVRYEDGGLLVADIVILARIWENLHLPPERPEPVVRGRPTRRPAAQPGASGSTPRS